MSELLVKKYGARDLAKAMLAKYRLDLNKLSDLETERVMVQGQMLGWQQHFKMEPPESAIAVFDYGQYEPVGHLKNFIDHVWGEAWKWSAEVPLGTARLRAVNHFASRVMWDLVNRNRTGKYPAAYNLVAGAASSGKTATAALYALAMFFIFRKTLTCKLVSTSATSAEDRIFGAAINLFEASHYGKNPVIEGDGRFHLIQGSDRRILYLKQGEAVSDKGERKDKFVKTYLTGIQLVPVQRGAEGQGAVRRLVGIKAKQKLLIVDESTDTDPSIFAENMLVNWSIADQFSQVVYLANPRWEARRVVSYLEPAKGWLDPDYDQESAGWATKRDGWCTQLNGLDTPNREWRTANDPKRRNGPTAPFPFLITLSDIESAERRCPEGRDSPAFSTMVVGFLCSESKSNTVWTYRGIQESGAQGSVNWTGDGSYFIMGADPNLSGGDKFVVCVARIGYGYDSLGKRKVYMEIEGFRFVPFVKVEHGTCEAGQVTYVQELAAEHGIGSESIGSDCTGASMSFTNAFEIAMGGNAVHRVHFAAAPSERIAGPGERRTAAEAYMDAKSELGYSLRSFLPFIRGLKDEDCIDQGCSRLFFIKGRDKILLESKFDFKARLGTGSPDSFDALSVVVDLARTMGLGTDILSHPLAAQSRLGRNARIVTRAAYKGLGERLGMARYGIPAEV